MSFYLVSFYLVSFYLMSFYLMLFYLLSVNRAGAKDNRGAAAYTKLHIDNAAASVQMSMKVVAGLPFPAYWRY